MKIEKTNSPLSDIILIGTMFVGCFFNITYIYKPFWLYIILVYSIVYFLSYKVAGFSKVKSIWVINGVSIFTLIARPDPLFTDAHAVYFPQILSSFNFGNVNNFWISKLPPAYPAFSWINKSIISSLGIDSINLILFLINSLFVLSIFLLFNSSKENLNPYVPFCTVVLITFLFGIDSAPPEWAYSDNVAKSMVGRMLGFSNLFIDGLSSYTEFSSRRALVPASFDILILIPLYLFIKNRFKSAIFIGFIISIFHYFSFINLFMIISAVVLTKLEPKLDRFKINYMLFVVSTSIVIYLSIQIINGIYSSDSIQNSLNILTYERLSPEWNLLPIISFGSFLTPIYLFNPTYLEFNLENFSFVKKVIDVNFVSPTLSSFDTSSVFPFEYLLVCALGIFLSRKKGNNINSNVILVGLSVSTITWFLQAFGKLGSFAIFSTWRLSAITVLISLLTIISFFMYKLSLKNLKLISFSLLITFVFIPFTNSLYNTNLPDKEFIDNHLIEYATPNSGEIIIPNNKTSWILNSGGIAAYSTKLFPYDVEASGEWLYRYDLQRKIEQSDNCQELKNYISQTSSNIQLIVTSSDNAVSQLKGKCGVRIEIYE